MMLENLEVGMMDDVCAESVVGEVGPGGAAAAPEVNGRSRPRRRVRSRTIRWP